MDSLTVHINRYGELVRWRDTLSDLEGHQCLTAMSEYLSYAEPERLGWDSIRPGLSEVLGGVRGDIHKEIEKELHTIAHLLYGMMRPEVDRLVALRDKRRKQLEVRDAIEAEKRAKSEIDHQKRYGGVKRVKTNPQAERPPGPGDGSEKGYSVGSEWRDILTGEMFECIAVSPKEAKWRKTGRIAVLASLPKGSQE